MNIADFKHVVHIAFIRIQKFVYPHTFVMGIILSIITSCYLIADYGVANETALPMLWSLMSETTTGITANNAVLAKLIGYFQLLLGIHSPEFAAYTLMVLSHAVITGLMVLIARQLSFSVLTQWALLFLFLSHPTYNDFRAYIISEPLFWSLWLAAIYLLLHYYRSNTVLAIVLWLAIFLLATFIDVAAWFWLLLFPFGALFWKPWRRRSVSYALLSYAVIVGILIFLPFYQGVSPYSWFINTIIHSPTHLFDVLSLNNNNWIQKDDYFLASVFVISGGCSLIIVRILISFNIACLFLCGYAIARRQYRIINEDKLRIVIYAICFDWFISVVLLVLGADSNSILSFSTVLLLLFFSALGLSYTFKKIYLRRFSDLTILLIIWLCVTYFASAFIIFGPRKDFLKTAGLTFAETYPNAVLYSTEPAVLFYSGMDPNKRVTWAEAQTGQFNQMNMEIPTFYAYDKSRKKELPNSLINKSAVMQFANPRGDTILIYSLNKQ